MRVALCRLFLVLSCASLCVHAQPKPSWTTPIAPFQIADNLYYVGGEDLASYLVVTPQGNILINANFSASPALIRASVEKLGFRWQDTKILLNSQAHDDHMGGAAAILRETHAKNMVMDGDVSVVETGAKTDFLAPSPNVPGYAPAHVDRILHDQDTVTLGGVTLTAHKTAGHTRGCTTWTMRSHLPGEPAATMRNIVIVGGTAFWSEYPLRRDTHPPRKLPGHCRGFPTYLCPLARSALRCISRSPRRILRYARETEALSAAGSPCLYRSRRVQGLRRRRAANLRAGIAQTAGRPRALRLVRRQQGRRQRNFDASCNMSLNETPIPNLGMTPPQPGFFGTPALRPAYSRSS